VNKRQEHAEPVMYVRSDAISSNSLPRLATKIRLAPCWANCKAASLPMPDEAPVISTVLPLNFTGGFELIGIK